MQFLGVNGQVFGLVLAALFLVCCMYALLVRWMANNGVDGQTAWMVVIGVAITLSGAAFVVNLEDILKLLLCFVASGTPMIIEYISRVQVARKKDHKQAQDERKDLP